MSMDITNTAEPRSDQQNYDDYISGPKTLTITEVKRGSAEQPVELHVAEFPGRPYKPGKSMRRVLIACWGPDASVYAGRQLTLYGDPTIKFGKEAVGGIRISHLSHLTEPKTIALTVTRGKRAPFTVQPLAADSDDVAALKAAIQSADSLETLQRVWQAAVTAGVSKHLVAAKDARKAELAADA